MLYALIGACITHKIGQRLFSLNWEQQRSEADFRANVTMPNKLPSMVASLWRSDTCCGISSVSRCAWTGLVSHLDSYWMQVEYEEELGKSALVGKALNVGFTATAQINHVTTRNPHRVSHTTCAL